TLLLGAVCLLWATTFMAQSSNYYWADNSRMDLTASNTHFIITADDPSILTNARPTNVKSYESWVHKPYAVAEANSNTAIHELIVDLGFDTDEVQISPGYALSDGFIIYPTRTVVAKLIDKEDTDAMMTIAKRFGVAEVTKKFGTYRIELEDVNQVLNAANAMQESGLFYFAQPDFYAPIERYQINDPLFSQQFQMNNTGQTLDGVTGANDADCNALEAWSISLGSSGTTVAVIDDGLENHEDFNNSAGQSRYTAGFSPANNGNGNAVSGSAHGVSCAGSISASHNSIGVRGVAPLANMISVNIFVGGESTQDIADGFTWAKNQGADVMSNSWGYTSCTANFSNINNAMADANSNGRGGLGCVIIFASGNGYKSCVDYPARNSNVVAVGAFANTGIRSAYSNYGPTLDIVAPSNNVGGPGAGVRTTDRMGGPGYNSSNYTSTFGGTSSACPVVAGVATLVLGFNPSLTSTEVKNILYSTAIDMGPAGDDNEYANGRVNAFGALQAAGGGSGPTCTDGIQNGQETGVDCGGPDCPSCPTGCNGTEVTLTITLDNYPEETSWVITNDAGVTVASGGTYGSFPDGSTITENICLVDDCYTFTINDSFGDGICCAYGTGSYTLSNGGTVLASGGSFGSSEATDFCIGGSGPDTSPPTQPTNLAVSNEQDTQVTLSWNASSDNVGVTSYEIFVDGTSLGTTAGTSVNITGLTACTSYNFGVRALDAAGNTSGTATTVGSTTGCTGGGTPFTEGYFFETGLEGWVDGGSDCLRYSGSRSWEGSYSIRLRDNSGVASSMTSPSYNLAGLGSVEINFYFYPNSMENGEDFWVRYNDGSGWQTVATYASGTSFNNNSFYSATVTLDAASFNLTDGAQFRIQCDASANADRVYIDEVTVTGSLASGSFTGAIATIEEIPTFRSYDDANLGESDVQIAPNPASDLISVSVEEEINQIIVFSVDGREILRRKYEGFNQATLDVSSLAAGVYLISVQTEEELITERLMIHR
ncbi:MAG: S8 family serine peptidase, partial [Bacteroidota bacterium]